MFRVGYVGANPVTALNETEATRFPAGVLTPAAEDGGTEEDA